MSDRTSQTSGRSRPEGLFVGLAVVALMVVLFALSGQRQQTLRTSPSGFDGLQVWLNANGQSAQAFTGGWTIDQYSIGQVILPLYDSDLTSDRVVPRTPEELLLQQDENDREKESIIDRADSVASMIILPKWRSGMRLTGSAHPELLIEEQRLEALFRDLFSHSEATVRRLEQPFTEYEYEDDNGNILTATLYSAQVLSDPDCWPIIGDQDAMILAECKLPDSGFTTYILADPDLFNNQGLRLGDNAKIALDFLSIDDDLGTTLIDYSRQNWLVDDVVEVKRDRTWADLKRFFGPPFTTLWIGLAVVLGIALWRGGMRFGPVRDAMRSNGASKFQAIDAQARLLRLTDQDGALLSDYALTRIAAVTRSLLGPGFTHGGTDTTAFFRHVRRHRPDLATEFETLLSDIQSLPPAIGATQAIGYVDALETLLERLANDT